MHCKLVNFAETDGSYAALSYCWGELDYKRSSPRRGTLQVAANPSERWSYLRSSKMPFESLESLIYDIFGLTRFASEDRLVDAAEAPFSISPSLQGLDNLDPHATSFATRVSEYWHGSLIARGYSRHETTYEKDRLIAVSGLARRVGAATNSKYLAGLWQSTLTHNLSW